MKFIFLTLLIVVLENNSFSQGTTVYKQIICSQYDNFPCALKDSSYGLEKGQSINIEVGPFGTSDSVTFCSNSTYKGKYKGQDITEKKFNTLGVSFIDAINTSKILNIKIGDKFSDLRSGDTIYFSLVKGNNSVNFKFYRKTLSSNSPQVSNKLISPDVLANYFYTTYFHTSDPNQNDPAATINPNIQLEKTDIGYRDISDRYTIHIFLDQFGNSLFGSIPTGIQRKYHYQLHVLYLKEDSSVYKYVFNATSGTLSDNMVVYNSNATPPSQQSAKYSLEVDTIKKENTVADIAYNFFPTTDDLAFDLDALKIDSQTKKMTLIKIQSYTIKKTPFYIGSFGAGIFNTWLFNPSYQLVNLPSNTATPPDQTVKITDNGTSVNVTFMYTFYFSIWNLIFPDSHPFKSGNKYKYNSWGRTYFDDNGSIFRKIYPAVGIGLSGTVLNNWYAGFNMEPMQGLGIFAGQNIRKINTFDMPNLTSGTTVVTQSQFDFYQNTKWKGAWAVGIIIDMSVFSKIASSLTATSSK